MCFIFGFNKSVLNWTWKCQFHLKPNCTKDWIINYWTTKTWFHSLSQNTLICGPTIIDYYSGNNQVTHSPCCLPSLRAIIMPFATVGVMGLHVEQSSKLHYSSLKPKLLLSINLSGILNCNNLFSGALYNQWQVQNVLFHYLFTGFQVQFYNQ